MEKLPKLYMKPNILQQGMDYTPDGTIAIPLKVTLIGKFHNIGILTRDQAEEFIEWAMEVSEEAIEDLAVEIAWEFNRHAFHLNGDTWTTEE